MKRAGVDAPSHGAHILRHSLASRMLREGATLDVIGAVLRHRHVDTTAIYAKIDIGLLRQIAQPWPVEDIGGEHGFNRCFETRRSLSNSCAGDGLIASKPRFSAAFPAPLL